MFHFYEPETVKNQKISFRSFWRLKNLNNLRLLNFEPYQYFILASEIRTLSKAFVKTRIAL